MRLALPLLAAALLTIAVLLMLRRKPEPKMLPNFPEDWNGELTFAKSGNGVPWEPWKAFREH